MKESREFCLIHHQTAVHDYLLSNNDLWDLSRGSIIFLDDNDRKFYLKTHLEAKLEVYFEEGLEKHLNRTDLPCECVGCTMESDESEVSTHTSSIDCQEAPWCKCRKCQEDSLEFPFEEEEEEEFSPSE
jgi:hypothetical protein